MLHKSIVDVCKENQGCVPTIVKHNLNSGKCLWGKKKDFKGDFVLKEEFWSDSDHTFI